MLQGESWDIALDLGATASFNLDDGEFRVTQLPNTSQPNIIGYNTSTGAFSYFDTSSFGGDTLYTADGSISGNRTVTLGPSDLLTWTGSVGNIGFGAFIAHTTEVIFPLVPDGGPSAGASAQPVIMDSTGRLFTTSSDYLANAGITTNDTEVFFNDGGSFGGESTFTYDKTNNQLTIRSAGTGTDKTTPAVVLRSSDDLLVNNDVLGQIGADQRYVSGTYSGMVMIADGAWSPSNVPQRLQFQCVSGTTAFTAMTIRSTGRVGVGVGNPTSGFFQVNGDVSGTSIYASANIVAYSDARSKTNVDTIEGALDKVNAIRGVTYNKVEDPEGIRYMGVIAQELQPHIPEVVAEGEEGDLAVAYGNISGVLIEAIKELTAKVESLEQELKDLKS